MNEFLPSTKILGTKITTASREEVLEYIVKRLLGPSKKFYIVTPNPEILVYATRSSSYQKTLNTAAVSLPDGIGVIAAGNILNIGLKGRITGTDFMYELCKECAINGLSIGLLGGTKGVAEKTAKCLREKYPDLRVIFTGEEWEGRNVDYGLKIMKKDPSMKGELNNHKSIINNHIDILFVAFGAPKQEDWIAKNLENIDVTCAMGVGGAFDFISEKVIRAPFIVRSIGMEWAYRLISQPWRAKRQLALPVFAVKIARELLS